MKITLDICATLLRTEITPLIRRRTPLRNEPPLSAGEPLPVRIRGTLIQVRLTLRKVQESLRLRIADDTMHHGRDARCHGALARHGGDFTQVTQKI